MNYYFNYLGASGSFANFSYAALAKFEATNIFSEQTHLLFDNITLVHFVL